MKERYREGRPPRRSRHKYPLATVIPYGPDDRTVTKLAVGIIPRLGDHAGAMEQWVGTQVATDPQVARQMHAFMRAHGVKTVCTATAILGCPHEEGEDFPKGGDCPFCPFWKGKQGSGSPGDPRWDALKGLRVEKLGPSYRFWMPG